jgi:hypothetical protein
VVSHSTLIKCVYHEDAGSIRPANGFALNFTACAILYALKSGDIDHR